VKFTFQRMLAETGSNASMYRSIAKIEALDRYTVRFTLSEPFAWFLDMVASPMAGGIVARECVEKFGDLKKPEASISSGRRSLLSARPRRGQAAARRRRLPEGLPGQRVLQLVRLDRPGGDLP